MCSTTAWCFVLGPSTTAHGGMARAYRRHAKIEKRNARMSEKRSRTPNQSLWWVVEPLGLSPPGISLKSILKRRSAFARGGRSSSQLSRELTRRFWNIWRRTWKSKSIWIQATLPTKIWGMISCLTAEAINLTLNTWKATYQSALTQSLGKYRSTNFAGSQPYTPSQVSFKHKTPRSSVTSSRLETSASPEPTNLSLSLLCINTSQWWCTISLWLSKTRVILRCSQFQRRWP